MLKADLHLHTHWSHDSGAQPRSIVDRCIKAGLSCIAVTDHNSIAGALEVRDLAPFQVIIGEEIKSSAGDIIGLFLEEEIPKGLSPEETVRAIISQGGLVMVPHPFDRFRASALTYDALCEMVEQVDIVEGFNAHNFFQRDNEQAASFARKHRVMQVAVSDSHTPRELGSTYMEMPTFDGTPGGFKEALAQGRQVTRRAHPVLRLAPMYTKLRRRFS